MSLGYNGFQPSGFQYSGFQVPFDVANSVGGGYYDEVVRKKRKRQEVYDLVDKLNALVLANEAAAEEAKQEIKPLIVKGRKAERAWTFINVPQIIPETVQDNSMSIELMQALIFAIQEKQEEDDAIALLLMAA